VANAAHNTGGREKVANFSGIVSYVKKYPVQGKLTNSLHFNNSSAAATAVAEPTAEILKAMPDSTRAIQPSPSIRLSRSSGATALERPLLMSVEERPYPQRLNYQAFDLAEQLDLFTALRRHATRILRLQPLDAWLRVGVHSEAGVVTLRQLVFEEVRHLRHHLPFIAEKRAAMKG
jgi:hypothetical protein